MARLAVRRHLLIHVSWLLLILGCASGPLTTSGLLPNSLDLDTVKAGQFDTGKMWTFDYPPVEYFAKTYHFNPTKDWFDRARLAALRLPGCTAAFVSEDGLVMTNHHCARSSLQRVQKEGENLLEDGFFAATLEEERKAPVWVDQLVYMEDVTKEVQSAFESGTTDSAKSANRAAKIAEIQRRSAKKFKPATPDSMVFSVLTFYSGGRYALYGYRRYTDVRLVFAPEGRAAFFGGDPDNFTYPRYDFDCAFYRVYENDKPLKTANFFRFSKEGAKEGESVFVIGNPGTTNRLMTLAQLETLRDYQYPRSVEASRSRVRAISDYVASHPEKRLEYMNRIFSLANSLKANTGYLEGLQDPYLMAKKRDFERKLKSAVENNPSLRAKYGDPWKEIAELEAQRRALLGESAALTTTGSLSQYFATAGRIVDRARGVPERRFGGGRPGGGRGGRFFQAMEPEIEVSLLADQLRFMRKELGERDTAFNTLLAGRTPEQAAEELAKTSVLSSKEVSDSLLRSEPQEILASRDPFIVFALRTRDREVALREKLNELREQEAVPSEKLGRAIYEVYGTSIPPDATFSLRIADGVVKGYEYNGTLAPPVTTFYGLYDRYYSFGKQEPWLPGDRWIREAGNLNLSTPMDLVSTNDIIGGNSGSSMVNKDLEVVGLIFDGNIESLPGNIIFDETKNRSVAVHSSGLLEGIEKVYKADRLARELKEGRIVP
jgi:hypothetical protein